MTISNQASGIRPGVCTSATRPAAPYEGQVIYETDTDRTLVWNNSAWVFLSTSTANPVGLELIRTQTIGTSVSSEIVNNVFSSTYDNYRITITGGSQSTTAYLALQLGSSTSSYRYQFIYGNLATTLSTEGQTNFSRFNYVSISGSAGMFADISLIGPFLSQATMIQACGGHAGNYLGTLTGIHVGVDSFTGFTIIPSAGTMTGGTICVYGYKK